MEQGLSALLVELGVGLIAKKAKVICDSRGLLHQESEVSIDSSLQLIRRLA
ncbi:hypothetical protein D3C76_1593830 [compost metagenome]|jgi:hypothetical protein